MVSKKELIEKIRNTYCRLRQSKVHGVGVIAIRDIPKGVNPFKGERKEHWVKLNMKSFDKKNKPLIDMLDAFYVIEKNGDVWVNDFGLGSMNISHYMNTSKNPNTKTTDDGTTFITTRKIKKGEEILTDYADYDWKYE